MEDAYDYNNKKICKRVGDFKVCLFRGNYIRDGGIVEYGAIMAWKQSSIFSVPQHWVLLSNDTDVDHAIRAFEEMKKEEDVHKLD